MARSSSSDRASLAELQPCFIDVMGGTGSISQTVFNLLDPYTNPERCLP